MKFKVILVLSVSSFLSLKNASAQSLTAISEVDVSGTVLKVQNDFSQATYSQGGFMAWGGWRTTNFRWENVCQSNQGLDGCSFNQAQLFAFPKMAHVGNNSFISATSLLPHAEQFKNAWGTGGDLTRTYDFSIAGRDPNKTYRVSAVQKHLTQNADYRGKKIRTSFPNFSGSKITMNGVCEYPTAILGTGTWGSEVPLQINPESSLSVSFTIKPEDCPNNTFFISTTYSSFNKVDLKDFEITVLEEN